MRENKKATAILLAGGQGQRMQSNVPKQFLELDGKPLIYYALYAFDTFPAVDQIVLVTGEGQEEYCREQIIKRYGFHKVHAIVRGGAQRSDSVWEGLNVAAGSDYVMIHDGARPLIDETLLQRCLDSAVTYGASIAAVPVKDTIKTASVDGVVTGTPDRRTLWQVQTPQSFCYDLIVEAFQKAKEMRLTDLTDDAMVLERTLGHPVHIAQGSYANIKVTTPEDLILAEALLRHLGR